MARMWSQPECKVLSETQNLSADRPVSHLALKADYYTWNSKEPTYSKCLVAKQMKKTKTKTKDKVEVEEEEGNVTKKQETNVKLKFALPRYESVGPWRHAPGSAPADA